MIHAASTPIAFRLPIFTTALTCVLLPAAGFALPAGGTAVDGDITFNANNLNQTSARGIAEYSSFNIGAGEVYNVNNGSGATLIRDLQSARTEIMGNLNASGKVMLVNGNGVFFGSGAVVNVGSLIATTSDIGNANFMAGDYTFDQSSGSTAGKVINEGTILAGNKGTVALIGNGGAENHGVINATAGNIHLAAADRFVVDFDGDGIINYAVSGDMETAMSGQDAVVDNTGTLRAEKGLVAMTASAANSVINGVINTTGVVQASQASQRNGKIILSSGGTANLAGSMDAKTLDIDAEVATNTVGEAADRVNVKSDRVGVGHAVSLVKAGGMVDLADGTYVQTGTLSIDKAMTLRGASRAGTVIDSSGVAGYSIHVTAPDVTLQRFTLEGGSHYGVKVDRGSNPGTPVTNFTMRNATVRGSGRTEVDLNGVDGALIQNVRADGQGTAGNGFAVTGSTGVLFDNVKTDGQNTWGGIAIYPDGAYGTIPTSVQVLDAYGVRESNPLYVEALDFADVSLLAPEFGFAVRNNTFRAGAENFTYFQRCECDAADFATGSWFAGHNADSTIQFVNHDAGTMLSTVDAGHFLVVDGLVVSKAMANVADGGLIEVRDGIYTENSTLNVDKAVTLQGQSQAGTNIVYTGGGYGIHVTGDDVTLENFTLSGNGLGGGGHRGVKVDPYTDYSAWVDNFTLRNATVQNFGRTEVDLNGVRNARVENVTANGMGTQGNGFSVTSGEGVVFDGVSTDGQNGWGGLAVYSGGEYDRDTKNVQVLNSAGIAEENQVYVQNDPGFTTTNLYVPEYGYAVKNDGSYRGDSDQFTFFQRDEAGAVGFATSGYFGTSQADSTLQLVTHNHNVPRSTPNGNRFIVGNGMNIQKAVNAVNSGGRVDVRDGTYVQGGTLNIDKSLSLWGQSMGGTVIDSSGVSGYGIHVTANDVDMRRFTLNGGAHYGLKVDRGANTGTALTNFHLANATVRGSGRTEVDLNGLDGATLTNVRALGQNTGGNGFSITGSTNVVLDGVRTDGRNDWGGIAVYSDGAYGTIPTSVQVLNAGNVREDNALFVEASDFNDVTLYAPEFDFAVRNDSYRAGAPDFTHFQRDEADATAFATGSWFGSDVARSTIQTVSHDAGTPVSTVDGDNFIVAGGMTIGAAADHVATDGTIHVRDGIFDERLMLTRGVYIQGNGAGNTVLKTTTPALGDGVIAVNAPGGNVTLRGFEVQGTSGAHGISVMAGHADIADVLVDGQGNGGAGIHLNAPDATLATADTEIHNYDVGLLVEGDAAVPNDDTVALLNPGTRFEGNGVDIRMDANGYVTDAREATFADAATTADIANRVEEVDGTILLPTTPGSGLDTDEAVTQALRVNRFFDLLRTVLQDLGGEVDIAGLIEPAAGGEGTTPSEAQQMAELNRRLAIILQYFLDTGNEADLEDALRGLLEESASA